MKNKVMVKSFKRILVTLIIMISMFFATSNAFAISLNQDLETENEQQEELIEYGLMPEEILIKDNPNSDVSLYAASKIQIKGSFSRSSGKGIAHISAVRAGASKMQSTITLQVYNGNKYVDSNAKSVTLSKNGTTIFPTATFSVSSEKKYRIKIVITATIGGTTESSVGYRNLT